MFIADFCFNTPLRIARMSGVQTPIRIMRFSQRKKTWVIE